MGILLLLLLLFVCGALLVAFWLIAAIVILVYLVLLGGWTLFRRYRHKKNTNLSPEEAFQAETRLEQKIVLGVLSVGFTLTGLYVLLK